MNRVYAVRTIKNFILFLLFCLQKKKREVLEKPKNLCSFSKKYSGKQNEKKEGIKKKGKE